MTPTADPTKEQTMHLTPIDRAPRTGAAARKMAIAALLPLALAACAPDAWKANPNYDAFVNQILRNCGNQRMGEFTVSSLMDQDATTYSVYFVDLTSRWGQNRISTQDYIQGVMSVGGGSQSAGLKCIVAQKP
jgi:hypothetical protein